ncbi:MAG: hypothetical protein ACPGTU_09170 [Myxococcota bacterium]
MHPRFIHSLILVPCMVIGCDDWPRHKNVPSINTSAIDAGALPTDGVSVTWDETIEEVEPNDSPMEASLISKGEGWSIEGTLSGTGWDATASAKQQSSCGEPLAFPPAAPGNYTADVDWITISPTETGILCMSLSTSYGGARLDTALYRLDDCGEPTQVFVHQDTAAPIGLDVPSAHSQWAIPVDNQTDLGIGIAGFWPDDGELEIDWTVEVALVPSAMGAGDQLCPEAL